MNFIDDPSLEINWLSIDEQICKNSSTVDNLFIVNGYCLILFWDVQWTVRVPYFLDFIVWSNGMRFRSPLVIWITFDFCIILAVKYDGRVQYLPFAPFIWYYRNLLSPLQPSLPPSPLRRFWFTTLNKARNSKVNEVGSLKLKLKSNIDWNWMK